MQAKDQASWKLLSIIAVGTVSVTADAQVSSANVSPSSSSGGSVAIPEAARGTSTVDVISLRADGPGAPLRFGGVVPNSDRVLLNGRVLQRGKDYAVDNAAGVVYLQVPQRPGDQLTVSYRYDTKTATATSSAGVFPRLSYQVLPGSLGFVGGFGVAERAADGSVLKSNVMGWNNTFKFGSGGNLSGLLLVADRQKTSTQGGLNLNPNDTPGSALGDEGKSRFLSQAFQSGLMGGKVQVDYQDISKNFASFGSVRQNGYSDADVNRFQKEKGLTRTGFFASGLNFGNFKVSNSIRDVKDQAGGITWRSMGVEQKGFSFGFTSQKVDQGFQRFRDIAEADREQLMREQGMSRQGFAMKFGSEAQGLSFNSNALQDDKSSKGILRRDAKLAFRGTTVSVEDQQVDPAFARFHNLRPEEKQRFEREAGMSRQRIALDSKLLGGQPLAFSQKTLDGRGGEYVERSATYQTKTWSIEHASLGATKGFSGMGALQDPEADGAVRAIAKMHGDNVQIKGEERGAFLRGPQLQREWSKFAAQPFKDTALRFETMRVKGQEGGAKVETMSISGKRFTASLKTQDLGGKFNELGNLLELERQRLGSVAGLQRNDFTFNAEVGKKQSVGFSRMTSGAEGGGTQRTSASYNGQGVKATVNQRQVGKGAAYAGRLVDSEAAILASLQGFEQRDARLQLDAIKNIKLDVSFMEALNKTTNEGRKAKNLAFNWNVDRQTQFSFVSASVNNADPLSTLFSQQIQRTALNRDLGKYGKVQLLDELVSYDGKYGTTPDTRRQFVAYETKIDARTSLRTEQTRTSIEGGKDESINSNTISSSLTKRVGVSVTDTRIDRDGTDRDETKRNYGFWFDLGSGVRFSYGYARHLNGETAGTMNSTVSLGATNPDRPDQMNGVQVARIGDVNLGGGYGVNRWDQTTNDRTQAFSNFSLSTAKPMNFGPMRDFRFNFGYDAASDVGAWQRENRLVGLGGKFLNTQVGFDYRSQIAPNGMRAIDRIYRFETDPNEKNPLRGTVMYKARTLPFNDDVMIRDIKLTARVTKGLEVTHALRTNPDQPGQNVLLGTIATATRENEWRLDFKQPKSDVAVGGTWREFVNDQTNQLSVTGGVNLTLFNRSASPLKFFYGVEELGGNVQRRLTHRYHVMFEQRPGPNQAFNLFLGNLSFENSVAPGMRPNNWSMRLDYQLRFR